MLNPTETRSAHTLVAVPGYVIDLARDEVRTLSGERVELRPRSFAVLRLLASNAGHLTTKDTIMNEVWDDVVVTDDALTQCIADIRRILRDEGRQIVRTVSRRGYVLMPMAADTAPRPDPVATQEQAGEPPEHARPDDPATGPGSRLVFALAMVTLLTAGLGWYLVGRTTDSPTIASAGSDAAWQSPKLPSGRLAALADLGITPIIVLPFSQAGAGYTSGIPIADFVTDDLTSRLSAMPGLRVISRQTARYYGRQATDAAALAAELGVRFTVEGRIEVADDRLSLQVDLINARTRLVASSLRFDVARSELPRVRNEIAMRLARELQVDIRNIEAAPVDERSQTLGVLMFKGWQILSEASRSRESLTPAEAIFRQILDQDPRNAAALVGLAAYHVTAMLNFFVTDREPALTDAERMLAEAAELSPNYGPTYLYLGLVRRMRGDLAGAAAQFERSIELIPSNPSGYAHLGLNLLRSGRPTEAVEQISYALRLSPRDPAMPYWWAYLGEAHVELGHDSKALEELTRAATLAPNNSWVTLMRAAALAASGDVFNARVMAAEGRKHLSAWTEDQVVRRTVGFSSDKVRTRRIEQGLRVALASGS